MKTILSLLTNTYRIILLLYPRQFRAEFGEEMQVVFSHRIGVAAQQGIFPLLDRLWLETYTLPTGLAAAYSKPRPQVILISLTLGLIPAVLFSLIFIVWIGIEFVGFLIIIFPIAIAFSYGLVLMVWKISPKLKLLVGVLLLAGLLYPSHALIGIPTGHGNFLMTFLWWTLVAIPPLAVIAAAMLLFSFLELRAGHKREGMDGTTETEHQRTHVSRIITASLIVAVVLLCATIYNLYWLTIWDNTYDPLGYLWILLPVTAGIAVSIMLAIALNGKTRLIGIAYGLIVPGLIFAVSQSAQQIDFRQLTNQRAGRVVQAVELYYQHNGRYPEQLKDLVPRYTLTLREPVMIYGQDWCYLSGEDYYQLGYVRKDHWSVPILRVVTYASQGQPDRTKILCADEVAEFISRYPYYYLKSIGY